MSNAMLGDMLFWSSIINYSLLILWVLLYLFGGEYRYRISGKWFRLSREQSDPIQYGGIVAYKIGIALRLIG